MPPKPRGGAQGGRGGAPKRKEQRAGRNIRSKAYHENIVQQMRAQVPLEDATSPQEIALAREPRDAQVYFWDLETRTDPPVARRVVYPARGILIRYLSNTVLLQKIRIRYSLDRKERTEQEWKKALSPNFSYVAERVWLAHVPAETRDWGPTKSTPEGRLQQVLDECKTMDIKTAEENLRKSKELHSSFIVELDAIVAGTHDIRLPLPHLDLYNQVYGFVKGDAERAARKKRDLREVKTRYDEVMKAILTYKIGRTRTEALKGAYGLWEMRHLLRYALSYDVAERVHQRNTVVWNEDRAAYLLSKIAESKIKMKELRCHHIFEKWDREAIAAESAANTAELKPRIDKYLVEGEDGKLRPPPGYLRLQTQLKGRETSALRRLGITDPDEKLKERQKMRCEEGFRDIEMEDLACKLCCVVMTSSRLRDHFADGHRIVWSNFSLDAVLPRCHGHVYFNNYQWLCLACNFLKRYGTMLEALQQLVEIACAPPPTVEKNLFVPPSPLRRNDRELTDDQRDACRDQAAAMLKTMNAAIATSPDKAGDIDIDFIYDELVKVVLEDEDGDLFFLCSSRIAFKLRDASLDRIKSSRGYWRDNVRITSWVVNALKSNNEDDTQSIGYFDHVQANRAVLEAMLAAALLDSSTLDSPSPPPAATRRRRSTRSTIASASASASESESASPPPAATRRRRSTRSTVASASASASTSTSPPPAAAQRRRRARSPSPLPARSVRARTHSPAAPAPQRNHADSGRVPPAHSIFEAYIAALRDGHCGFHALAKQLGLTHMQVRAIIWAWAQANLTGAELELHREVLLCPADQDAAAFERRARNAQWLCEEVLQSAAIALDVEIAVERLPVPNDEDDDDAPEEEPYRITYRPPGGGAANGVVGLSHAPGHWSGGRLRDGIDLPPYFDQL